MIELWTLIRRRFCVDVRKTAWKKHSVAARADGGVVEAGGKEEEFVNKNAQFLNSFTRIFVC